MTGDRAALLRAVCERPDDTPRLVFADWLDSPHLWGLRRLRLLGEFPDEAPAAAVAPNFRGLYQLRLGMAWEGHDGAALNKLWLATLKAAMPDAAVRFD